MRTPLYTFAKQITKNTTMAKRFLTLFLVTISVMIIGGSYFCRGAESENSFLKEEDPLPLKERIILKHTKEGKPQTRSAGESIEAYAYTSSNCIELIFNQNLGTVTVTVSGPSGIESVTCDTASEFFVTIPVSFVPGQYFIEISGPEYEGYGQFEL